jgi:DUF2075 family protein
MRMDGRTDGWTDMTKLIVAFRNFSNAPQNHKFVCSVQVSYGLSHIACTYSDIKHRDVTRIFVVTRDEITAGWDETAPRRSVGSVLTIYHVVT